MVPLYFLIKAANILLDREAVPIGVAVPVASGL